MVDASVLYDVSCTAGELPLGECSEYRLIYVQAMTSEYQPQQYLVEYSE